METVRKCKPHDVKLAVKHAINCKQPIFIWGPPGIGKSDIVAQIGASMNAHVIDVRLSLWEPTDIKGIPYFNSNLNAMVWAPPAELPDDEMASQYDSIILFLDELNSAPPAVQAAAYQLILNRRVGTYRLPDNVYIVAAGNRETDKGVTYRMPAPLANRMTHIEMTTNFDDWFEWAADHNIHPDVMGFLQFSKSDLYDFSSDSPSRSFATPRSWSFVSTLLNEDTEGSVLTNLIAGTIGEGLAIKFIAHRNYASELPNPSDILDGKVKELKSSEISAMYSLAISMCYELKEASNKHDKNFNKKVNNFMRFSMDNFETEMVVMAIKVAITQYKLPIDPDEIECFDEFHDRFGEYIRNARA